MKKYVLLLLLFLFALPFKIQAACWCADPVNNNCQCGRTGTSNFSANVTSGGQSVKIYCDTQIELDSEQAKYAPICGAPLDYLPSCVQEKLDSSRYTCYGRSYVPKDKVDARLLAAPDKSWVAISGKFSYNNQTFTAANVFICDSNAIGCARSDVQSLDAPTNIPNPKDPNYYCNPQRTGVIHPNNQCAPPSGAGESRIFIPHLRNISALATLLQTMFNPLPSLFANNAAPVPAGTQSTSAITNSDDVTSKIYFHQGLDDATQYVSDINNSSLKVNAPAPDPLYSFTGDGVYKQDGMCSIADTKYNPGDDLLGPTITSGLLYTQKYTYPALPHPDGCVPDNQVTDNPDNCCAKAAGVAATLLAGAAKGPGAARYQCGTAPEYREETKGRIAVFTKTPLVDYIYNALVIGPQSVFRRLMPQNHPAEFKEIPGQASYSVSSDGQSLAVAGKTGATPTLYFPHVGSLKEYFLDGIQKALRPLSSLAAATQSQTPQGQCNTFDQGVIAAAIGANATKYHLPPSLLQAVFEIESAPYLANPASYSCTENGAQAAGPMQITRATYKDITTASEQYADDLSICDHQDGKLSRCSLEDNVELAAKILLQKVGRSASQGIGANEKITIYNAVNNYYGFCKPDSLTAAYAPNAVALRTGAADLNYGDIVLNKMGFIKSSADYIYPQCPVSSNGSNNKVQ